MSGAANNATTAPLVVLGSLGVVSTLICGSAVTLVFVHGLHKRLVYRLALYQVLGSLLHSVLLSVQLAFLNYGDGPFCQAVAFLYNSSHWFKLLALTEVTIHLFCFAVFYKNCKKVEVPFVVLLLIVPFAISAIPFATRSYGPTAPRWCWISLRNGTDATGPLSMQLVVWLVPAAGLLVVAFVLVAITLSVEVWRICCGTGTAIGPLKRALKLLCPLMAYPVAFIVFLVPPLAYSALLSAGGERYGVAIARLTYVTAVCVPMWSISSGLTLLVVVLCYRCGRTRKGLAPNAENAPYGSVIPNPPQPI